MFYSLDLLCIDEYCYIFYIDGHRCKLFYFVFHSFWSSFGKKMVKQLNHDLTMRLPQLDRTVDVQFVHIFWVEFYHVKKNSSNLENGNL